MFMLNESQIDDMIFESIDATLPPVDYDSAPDLAPRKKSRKKGPKPGSEQIIAMYAERVASGLDIFTGEPITQTNGWQPVEEN